MPWPLVPISAERQRPLGFCDVGGGCERGENQLTQPAAGSPTSRPQHHGLTNGTPGVGTSSRKCLFSGVLLSC